MMTDNDYRITPIFLQYELLENPEAYFLLDVREPFEYQIASLQNSVLINNADFHFLQNPYLA
jgi:rhodanese-related sulfurtransferase